MVYVVWLVYRGMGWSLSVGLASGMYGICGVVDVWGVDSVRCE